MLFNTLHFFVFYAIVLALFYKGPRSWRKVVLLIASYYFYMCWNAKFVLLLMTLTCIDFFAAQWIMRSQGRVRKIALIVSLGANLSFLGYFKYYNFLAGSLTQLLGMDQHSFMLSIVLPVGISFHTFQSMSYVIEVYRGQQEVIRNPIDYALFIAFFPQLVAGPIVRAREFFADLYHWRAPTSNEVLRGIFLTLLGLTKKIVVADQFAMVVNSYFGNIGSHPGWLSAWSGTIAFAIQIYFDFSGYTDMAIGVALLMGFHFPVNFRRPYLSATITEFWHRWHISLSRWLRDYLYISLGGNRGGKLQTYRNLMLTMLLGGLWHGASWNFVIWGGYHGVLLSVERIFGVGKREWGLAERVVRVVFTFGLVCIGWVFFRAVTLHDSVMVLGQMFSATTGENLILAWMMWMAGIVLVLAVAEERLEWFERIVNAPLLVYSSAIVFLLFCLEMLSVTGKAVPFIYFQF